MSREDNAREMLGDVVAARRAISRKQPAEAARLVAKANQLMAQLGTTPRYVVLESVHETRANGTAKPGAPVVTKFDRVTIQRRLDLDTFHRDLAIARRELDHGKLVAADRALSRALRSASLKALKSAGPAKSGN